MVTLQPITPQTRAACLALAVAPHQAQWVLTNAQALSEAEENADVLCPMGIHLEDGTPVGMLVYSQEAGQFGLWRLMIDAAWQRRGYGREALTVFLMGCKLTDPSARIFTTVAADNAAALALYHSFGFCESGRRIQGELELVHCEE